MTARVQNPEHLRDTGETESLIALPKIKHKFLVWCMMQKTCNKGNKGNKAEFWDLQW